MIPDAAHYNALLNNAELPREPKSISVVNVCRCQANTVVKPVVTLLTP